MRELGEELGSETKGVTFFRGPEKPIIVSYYTLGTLVDIMTYCANNAILENTVQKYAEILRTFYQQTELKIFRNKKDVERYRKIFARNQGDSRFDSFIFKINYQGEKQPDLQEQPIIGSEQTQTVKFKFAVVKQTDVTPVSVYLDVYTQDLLLGGTERQESKILIIDSEQKKIIGEEIKTVLVEEPKPTESSNCLLS